MKDHDCVRVPFDRWFDLIMENRNLGVGIEISHPERTIKNIIEKAVGITLTGVTLDETFIYLHTSSESDATAIRIWL